VHAFSNSDIGPLLLGFFGLVLVTGVGLIAWRGDQLRSPGGIDSPVSREGAFLLNNLLFVGFAFVVLLGTVFPLLYEALRGQQVTVGAPYFDTMSVPIVLALLFLMAVGPALPWRKTTMATLRDRLILPAWFAAAVMVACVVGGVRGLLPLVVFGLAAFALASNVRQLVRAMRTARRHGVGAWRGLVGRANGGMVVHIGVVVMAVAFAASSSFGHRAELTIPVGATQRYDGHMIGFDGLTTLRTPARQAIEALVTVDGTGPYRPAVSQFGPDTEAVGTPAIDSSARDDVYLTIAALPTTAGGAVTLAVTVQPLVMWLWVGAGIVVVGAVLAAVPGRRRRATDPVSAPVPAVAGAGRGPDPDADPALAAMGDAPDTRPGEPVGAGTP